ncbi:MAG: hypothetical protein WC408_02545 [Candidatus Micrarchaeia archaeon]|jgi:hypothetical protein
MAKVVIAWNQHPTENLAGIHARRCAELLKQMGHKVFVEKIPVDKTNYGAARKGTPKQAAKALKKIAQDNATSAMLRKLAKKHNAIAFSFHASTPQALGNSDETHPKQFNVGFASNNQAEGWLEHEICFLQSRGNYYVEIPAIFHPISSDLFDGMVDRVGAIKKESRSPAVMAQLRDSYQLFVNKTGALEQQKYLDPEITKLIAETIDKKIRNPHTRPNATQ